MRTFFHHCYSFITLSALVLGLVCSYASSSLAAGDALSPKEIDWPFSGMLGTVDRQSAQRGLQVYLEVCASCHSLELVSYRNLASLGFSPNEIKAIAADYEVEDGPDEIGDYYDRAAIPSDRFASPFPNELAARASNGGAYPVDLSLIVKARPNGANYVYSLLSGFGQEVPKGMDIPSGMHYNPYFPGGKIAMKAPLEDDKVEYMDETNATVDQMSYDVVNFLQWASEPEMEQRKRLGIKVLLYLAIFGIFCYIAKKRVWETLRK